jgi:hypothetical protein
MTSRPAGPATISRFLAGDLQDVRLIRREESRGAAPWPYNHTTHDREIQKNRSDNLESVDPPRIVEIRHIAFLSAMFADEPQQA